MAGPHPFGGTWTTAWLYAYLSCSRRWQWEFSNLGEEHYLAALRRDGIAVTELVVLDRIWVRRDQVDQPGSRMHGPGREWVRDIGSKRWRLTGGPPPPWPVAPVPAATLSIAFEPPRSGCIPTVMQAAGQHLSFQATDTDDPFPELVAWLEAVAYGQFPRVTLDLENVDLDLRLLPADSPRVRLLAIKSDHSWDLGIISIFDIAIDRLTLVRSLYDPLIAYTQGDAFRRGWDALQWTRRPWLEEEGQVVPAYDLRSTRLEKLLAWPRGV